MDDDSKTQSMVKWALGAMGLGVLATAAAAPKLHWMSLWIILAILVLALLLFGGYYLWQKRRARRQREQFTSAIEQQTAAAPRAISDPNKRASLDKVRQKFQTGLQEFKSRGKDIYKLPWYVIIGESGSGKSEAIRHSGIDFPQGMQDELQGSGGTVNMDWWFSNRGIILDTAGSMLFSESRAGEAPEWGEFLRLLKKSRPHCPINGLMLVLSIESLIKDSADRIAQKAGILAKQLELIQKTLDVRFPVYLIVTKCDLLTGFREFFDNIDDPLLQHQIFGWSNPDPLDSPFRPELVEQHLKVITAKIQRRRLALLRDATTAGQFGDTQSFYKSGTGITTKRRLDEVDAMCALPESIARLAPRLRRYLEIIFVAGEWSSKPVFLRGIYFTSSMREGKALDEAIAFATGLSLDQLPENRSWEKNRAFFLRDLFHEKVFREFGLVTRATNTLQMLRQRQFLIFGSAAVGLLLLITFAVFGYVSLKKNILVQSDYWKAGTDKKDWNQGIWAAGSVIQAGAGGGFGFNYTGTNKINVERKPSIVEYHKRLRDFAEKEIAVSWVFKPIVPFSDVGNLPAAQQALFEGGVIRPLVYETRNKMQRQAPDSQNPASVARHQAALLALMKLHSDQLSHKGFGATNQVQSAEKYLSAFLSYLTDADFQMDTNLPVLLAETYAGQKGQKPWPPDSLFAYGGGDHLSNNAAIGVGLTNLFIANQANEGRITSELQLLNKVVAALALQQQTEKQWLARSDGWPDALTSQLQPVQKAVEEAWGNLRAATNFPAENLTNLTSRYAFLMDAAHMGSVGAFKDINAEVPLNSGGILTEIKSQLSQFVSVAETQVKRDYQARESQAKELDATAIVSVNGLPAYRQRASLYLSACALQARQDTVDVNTIGNGWKNYLAVKDGIDKYQVQLAAYKEPSPFAADVARTCSLIAAEAEQKLKGKYVENYAGVVTNKLADLAGQTRWDIKTITNTENWLRLIESDLDLRSAPDDQKAKLATAKDRLSKTVSAVLAGIETEIVRATGFPVLLNAPQPMSVEAMSGLKELVNGLSKVLDDPIWQLDSAGVDRLRKRDGEYVSIVNALMDDQGVPTQWSLSFVPVGQWSEPFHPTVSDRDIIKDFRWVNLTFGGAASSKGWKDIAQETLPVNLGQGAADATLALDFRQYEAKPSNDNTITKGAWALVQLIRDFNATTVNKDGTTWRFQIRLEDKPQKMSGQAVFEVKLINPRRALPEIKDWPTQSKQ